MPQNSAHRFVRHRGCQALTELTLNQLPRDGSIGAERRHAKGASIWRPDASADSIFFLRRGRAEVLVDDLDGREILLRHIEASEPFGELCFCSGKGSVRFTHARATTESEVMEVKLDDFLSYLRANQSALQSLVFTFCMRLAEAENRIEILSHRGADGRLGRLLLQLAESRGIESEASRDKLIVRISHDELARMAAMSRPHVTVTIVKFRQLGLVNYGPSEPLTIYVPVLKAYVTEAPTNDMT